MDPDQIETTTIETPEPEAGPSIRDALGAALGDQPTTTLEQPEARPRDAQGRFAPTAQEQEAARLAQQQPTQQPTQQAYKPPPWYKPDYGVEWEQLPEQFRGAIAERERAISMELQRRSEAFRPWQALQEQLGEFAHELQIDGVQPAQYFAQLHQVNNALRENPEQTLFVLGQRAGVDWGALVRGILQQEEQAQNEDPRVRQLEQQLRELQNGVQTIQYQTQRERESAALSQVEGFFQTRPHRELVQQDMALLISNGRAQGLEDAYDMAVRLHPQLGPRMVQDQQRAQAERARAASVSSVRGSPSAGAGIGSASNADLRGTIEAAFEGLI